MAYVRGAVHGMSGSGTLSLAGPIGLSVSLSNIPPGITERFSTPPAFRGIGFLTVGNAEGWLPWFELTFQFGLFYPLPPGLEVAAYDLYGGVTGQLVELLEASVFGEGAYGV